MAVEIYRNDAFIFHKFCLSLYSWTWTARVVEFDYVWKRVVGDDVKERSWNLFNCQDEERG